MKWFLSLTVAFTVIFSMTLGTTQEKVNGDTESRLDLLVLLSDAKTKNKKIKTVNIGSDIKRCIKSMHVVTAYSGRTFIGDMATNNMDVDTWRIDYSAPDAIHVSQKMLDAELGWLYDEWITINEDHYQNAGLWSHKKRLYADESSLYTNSLLKVDNLLSILKSEKPIKAIECSYNGVPYIKVTYSLEKKSPHILKWGGGLDSGYITVHIWINQETYTLAKGSYIFDGTIDDNIVRGYIQQLYTNYGESFEVTPPPWVNFEANEKGEGEIINTLVPTVQHY